MITLRNPSSPYFTSAVWIGDLPDATYLVEAVVERDLAAPGALSRPSARAAAEYSRIFGPRAHFGLLGATYTPDAARQLRLRVATSGDDGPSYTGSSLRPRWAGQTGLPREYADAVIAGAALALEMDPLGSGELRFDRAVHHNVDSNNFTFQRLAMLVTRLLQPDAASMSEEELAALAEKYALR